MILIYNLIDDNKGQIRIKLLSAVQRDVPALARHNRHELKPMVESYIESLLDLMASGNDEPLRRFFRYMIRNDSGTSLKKSAMVRFIMAIAPILRQTLQENFRDMPLDGKALYNQGMNFVDQTLSTAAAAFLDEFDAYIKNKIAEQNQYLMDKRDALGVDLSQFILFRG